MDRRSLIGAAMLAVVGTLFLPATGDGQNAQRPPAPAEAQQKPPAKPEAAQPKSYKDMLVGTWRLLIADKVEPDNTQKPMFGPNPMGTLIFTANGHYSLQIMRYGRPKFAVNDGSKGTADENKAATSQMISILAPTRLTKRARPWPSESKAARSPTKTRRPRSETSPHSRRTTNSPIPLRHRKRAAGRSWSRGDGANEKQDARQALGVLHNPLGQILPRSRRNPRA